VCDTFATKTENESPNEGKKTVIYGKPFENYYAQEIHSSSAAFITQMLPK